MSNKTPIFPIPEPQHFSDYGFDPQIDYFQVLEEARRHKITRSTTAIVDTQNFKLQKPISRDESSKKIKKNNKKRWWKNAFHFFKWKLTNPNCSNNQQKYPDHNFERGIRGSISGPVYITESRSGSSTPFRTTSRPSSGPLAGNLSPAEKDEMGIPYISLRDINVDQEQYHRMSTSSAMPIYLVT